MKTLLITGGSGAIGAACCKKFASNNFNIIFTYNKNIDKAMNVAKVIKNMGVDCNCIKMDVSNKIECAKVLDDLITNYNIDILVNNAGIVRDSLFYWMTADEWEEVIQTNLNGIFYVTSPIVKQMIQNKNGSIINISSISGISGNVGQTNYSASKAAIIGFTKSLSLELARNNIRVNCVAPGVVESEMTANIDLSQLKKMIPMKRFATPEEIAEAVFFLASEKASYITGEVLNVSGGLWR